MKKRFSGKMIFIYLMLYFVLNLLFLDKFPFMHSDESWLSGLTRAMMSAGPSTTETFFDLLPRYPHAVKMLFHILQMPFILVFDYGLFSVRLISLLFGTATLYLFYRLALHLSKSNIKAFIITVILSLDIQFIYASHFARQDIIISFGIIAVVYYIIRFSDSWSIKRDVMAGIITGIFIGFHPNSLMVALCAGSIYLYYIFQKQFKPKNLLVLIVTVSCFAGIFIGLSYLFDSRFFPHYLQYGSTLGVDLSLLGKLKMFPRYFMKLFYQVSGTYYAPPIQFQLVVFTVGVIVSCVVAFFRKHVRKLLLPILAVCVGIILIGRYSQPGIILLFPLCYLLVFYVLDMLIKKYKWILALLLGCVVLVNSVLAIIPYLNNDYHDYLEEISAHVPNGSKVLANLNCEYAFENGVLLDYRNLEYLEAQDICEYIRSRDIEYIIYPEEMDFIYEKRPVWNIIYGNLHPYYEEMKTFLEDSCTQVYAFSSPYAMRIVRFSDTQDWAVRIYRVESEQ